MSERAEEPKWGRTLIAFSASYLRYAVVQRGSEAVIEGFYKNHGISRGLMRKIIKLSEYQRRGYIFLDEAQGATHADS